MRSSAPETILLRELLAAGSGWVSGTRLAAKVGLSRVAVWKHLGRLEDEGFGIEAVRGRGYRLVRRPEQLSPPLVHALLRLRAPRPTLLFHPEIDSTNSEAERLLAAGHPTPFVVVAAAQTAGRGRFGRVWHSPPEGNLYASFCFRPRLEPARLQLLTLWLGLNLAEVLASLCQRPPGLKWPNDLLYDGRKVAGLLTEARVDADQTREVVCGLGLNVNGLPAQWPRELARTATSLAQVLGRPLDLNQLAAAVIGRVLSACETFFHADVHKRLLDGWPRFDVLAGQTVTVRQGSTSISGTAAGIDDTGALRVEVPGRGRLAFRAGEVTLERPATRP